MRKQGTVLPAANVRSRYAKYPSEGAEDSGFPEASKGSKSFRLCFATAKVGVTSRSWAVLGFPGVVRSVS
jgi:hypothetical protein